MKILVTGAAGFIGSNLCEFLLSKGHQVIGLDNFNDYYSPKVKRFNIESFEKNANFQLAEIDILNVEGLESMFTTHRPEAIVHLAGWAGVTYSVSNPKIYLEVNIVGTNNLAQMATKHGVNSFVFASTSSIYGNTNPVPFNESMDSSKPASPYPASKKAAEVLLWTYKTNFDLNVTIFRFFNPLGPKLRPDMALPKLVKAAEYGLEFPLYMLNIQTAARDYTHIVPMLETMEYVCENPLSYEILNLGNSQPIELANLIQMVERVTGKSIKIVKKPLPGQMEVTYANVEAAKKIANYNPRFSAEQAVEEYYQWFLKQPEWYKKGEY
ncbi:NAD-dependent epimerase/dehydratase family protein [Candidatus Nomurabacteria bacterium]|uniref:NAD-dependent epimerase/dehydratase family protein n=1 Tax=candidate division WWE3 bacterium TaxID=2053526 RepID=A0A955IVM6_UNCKA|nr:NAD-dependent epimerase/dehydratase family protein [candidate division WWE3 bacterium]MCB9823366.1 NAD-dependent epimerase/dehydratase family protein [Candidatus Nomurabacteria bacterium]MCB9826741.1 NAD-dependent epimerase/dehydratase family protein [Candidatus Nomurabacteria bacterium]MCB9827648.1 NAD-dependent epimerase/dehydratase family protein [Candidatus Nomurabacteria bacterium]HXK52696.1 NAD-dependent epimerase/dehydratase family protein [bacterium]